MKASFMSDKRAVSLMVSYTILIAITISLSIMVFTWLRFFAAAEDAPECPDGIHLIIADYSCTANPNGTLNVTLKNKGRFIVEDFTLRVNPRSEAEFGIYALNSSSNRAPIDPGKSKSSFYNLNESSFPSTENVRLIDVQPMVVKDGKTTFCRSFSTQRATCP